MKQKSIAGKVFNTLLSALMVVTLGPGLNVATAYADEGQAAEVISAPAESAPAENPIVEETATAPQELAAEEESATEVAPTAIEAVAVEEEDSSLEALANEPAETNYLTITCNSVGAYASYGTVSIAVQSGTVETRLAGSSTWEVVQSPAELTLGTNQTREFRGTNASFAPDEGSEATYGFTLWNGSFTVSGSVTSLTDGVGTDPNVQLTDYCYANLFANCTRTAFVDLKLPATTLAKGCYQGMFQGCTSLMAAPALPATQLPAACYQNMFKGCTALTEPAQMAHVTSAASENGSNGACAGMYEDCTSVKVAFYTDNYTYCRPLVMPQTGDTGWSTDMFKGTSGYLTRSPNAGTTYYAASAKETPVTRFFVVALPTDLEFSATAKTATVTLAEGVTGMGDITVKYFNAQGQQVESAIQPGTYTVKLDIAESDTYHEMINLDNDEWEFTIAPRKAPKASDFTYSGPSATSYDGTLHTATVESKVEGMGAITVHYYDVNDNEVEPRELGLYYVGITVEEGEVYLASNGVIMDSDWNFTIVRSTPTVHDFTFTAPEDLHYTGAAKAASIVAKDAARMGEMTIRYYKQGSTTALEGAPTDLGTYTVTVEAARSAHYNATGEITDPSWTFTIGKGIFTADLIHPYAQDDLTYDGYGKYFWYSCAAADQYKIRNIQLQYFYEGDLTNPVEPILGGHYTIGFTAQEGTHYYGTDGVVMTDTSFEILKDTAKASYFTFSTDDLHYDGNPKHATVAPKNAGACGEITVKYFKDGAELEGAPTEEGTYQVHISAKEGTSLYAVDDLTDSSWQFTIGEAEPNYLTFEAVEDSTISWGSASLVSSYYRYANTDGEWLKWHSFNGLDTYGTGSFTLRAGEKIQLRAKSYASSLENDRQGNPGHFVIEGKVKASGNVASLTDNNGGYSDISWEYVYEINGEKYYYHSSFAYMFYGCEDLIAAPEIIAQTTVSGAFAHMFDGCTGLTVAPELTATTLAENCYAGMFKDCTGLTTAPELKVTTLAEGCYAEMFSGCTGLTAVPDLMATQLPANCYKAMFSGCTGLALPLQMDHVTTAAANSCERMYYGCSNLKVNAEKSSASAHEWNTPQAGEANWSNNMLAATGGTQTEDPAAGTTYYIAGTDKDVVTFLGANAFSLSTKTGQKAWDGTMEYSTDLLNWTAWNGEAISAHQYDEAAPYLLYLRGSNNTYISGTADNYGWNLTVENGGQISITGNLETLRGAVKNLPATKTMAANCYRSLFEGWTALADISELTLPTTTLSDGCYQNMFKGCTALTAAPELPAKTMAANCYRDMFMNCTALTAAPDLPATTLAQSCYYGMFSGCSRLASTPELPAKTMAVSCYENMFKGCAPTSAPALSADTLADSCYDGMFYDCASLTAAPQLNAATLADNCYANMFRGCTSLTEAPALPAETLANYCYANMFMGCTSLTAAPALPAQTLTTACYLSMFNGCTKLVLPADQSHVTTVDTFSCMGMYQNCSSLKIGTTRGGHYSTPWKVSGAASSVTLWNGLMLDGTSGSFTDDPAVNTTYYVYTEKEALEHDWFTFAAPSNLIADGTAKEATVTCSQEGVGALTLRYFDATGTELEDAPTTAGFYTVSVDVAESATYLSEQGITAETWAFEIEPTTPNYLTFTAQEASTISLEWVNGENVQYSLNGALWQSYTEGATLELAAGDILKLRGSNVTTGDRSHFTMTGKIAASGSVTSLTSGNGSSASVALTEGCYAHMFRNCAALTTAPELPGKETVLAKQCYLSMFYQCTGLTAAPALPAEILAEGCYENMFYGCANLAAAPELPAKTLAKGCYTAMFVNCTNLTAAPELPAETLAEECYLKMFWGCTNLAETPELPATQLPTDCYQSMFRVCTSLAYAANMSHVTAAAAGSCKYMYQDCTGLKLSESTSGGYGRTWTAPATAEDGWSISMFAGTSGTFTGAPEAGKTYYAPRTGDDCLTFTGTGPFSIEPKEKTAGHNWNGTMEYSTDKITWTTWEAPFSAISAAQASEGVYVLYVRGYGNGFVAGDGHAGGQYQDIHYERGWKLTMDSQYTLAVSGNIETLRGATATDNSAATGMDFGCYTRMFEGWTNLVSGPTLTATNLSHGVEYADMFKDCTSLTTPADLSMLVQVNYYSLQGMYEGCTSLQMSEIRTDAYTIPWQVGTADLAGASQYPDWDRDLLKNTGGTFTGNPEAGKTYYLASTSKTVPATKNFTFTAPENLAYDGTVKEATVTAASEGMGQITVHYHQSDWDKESTPVNIGTYRVVIDVAEGDSFAAETGITSADWTFTITKAEQAAPDASLFTIIAPAAPGDFISVAGVTAAMEYSVDGGTTFIRGTGETVGHLTPGVIPIRYAENDDCLASPATNVTLPVYRAIFFEMNDHGTAPATQMVLDGSTATKPADPTAEGYVFGGWYSDLDCTDLYDFNAAVKVDVTLHAKWIAVGDVNASGKINIVDAQIVYELGCGRYGDNYEKYLALFPTLTKSAVVTLADFNKDGVLDGANDAFAIQHYIHYR